MEATDTEKILIVADDNAPNEAVRKLHHLVGGEPDVRVVAPALVTRLELWTSDIDPGEARAKMNLRSWINALAQRGLDARGQIGDPDPNVAINDALAEFDANLLILVMRRDLPHWSERALLDRVRLGCGMAVSVLGGAAYPTAHSQQIPS